MTECLSRDADKFAEEAEGKAGSKMAQLITKSNALRRASKDKSAELKNIEEEISIYFSIYFNESADSRQDVFSPPFSSL